MSRKSVEPYRVGDFWLSTRRDGKSPGIWQITRYSEASRCDVYRSARTRDLEVAKEKLHAHVEKERSKKPQTAEEALIVPQLNLYWKEHGENTRKPGTIATSLRAFIGFLMQDELGPAATVSSLRPVAFARFRNWRMKPHSFTVPWGGKPMVVESDGVRGETVQRNLDDVRAALNHAAANGRIPYAPKVPSVPTTMRSPARDVRVSLEDLGAMIGFASSETLTAGDPLPADEDFTRWLWLMIATGCRPEAAMAFDPRAQWRGEFIELHPPSQPRTKKRNPVVPTIEPFKPILEAWRGSNSTAVKSRRTAWRTMRRALDLPADVIPKTIRHTVATELRSMNVPGEQVSGLLGHRAMHRTTEVYAKYDPAYLREAKAALTTIFETVQRHAKTWLADHSRTKVGNGRVIVVARESGKV
jgi:hypothetical protein